VNFVPALKNVEFDRHNAVTLYIMSAFLLWVTPQYAAAAARDARGKNQRSSSHSQRLQSVIARCACLSFQKLKQANGERVVW